jgi:hypothetical protein
MRPIVLETRFGSLFRAPFLTPARVRLAYAIGVTTDTLQFALGPVGWAGVDEILDAIAAILTWWTIGFHPLLLPTFVLELMPVVDMLPTWTGCIAIVIALRRKQQRVSGPPGPGQVIDV